MTELRFRVTTLNPAVTPEEMVSALVSHIPDLSAHLKNIGALEQNVSLNGSREQSIPIDPNTAYLVLKFVGISILSGALNEIGKEIVVFFKARIKNGRIDES